MNYWIVGAMWGGLVENDALEDFLLRGYWYCWDRKTTPPEAESTGSGNSVAAQRERFKQMRAGDRIAVKKNISVSDQKIEIRAIGIVKDIDFDEWRAYVSWLPVAPKDERLARIVDMHGCSASVHGPYKSNDPWIREIFLV